VVVPIELKRVDCGLVVNTDENFGARGSGDGEEGVDGFLDGMEFRVVNLSSTAKVAAALADSGELAVTASGEDRPTTAGCSTVKLGAVGVDDHGMVGERVEPCFV
jgi:hypothetical protein